MSLWKQEGRTWQLLYMMKCMRSALTKRFRALKGEKNEVCPKRGEEEEEGQENGETVETDVVVRVSGLSLERRNTVC